MEMQFRIFCCISLTNWHITTLLHFVVVVGKTGFEPITTVLQTAALPLELLSLNNPAMR